MKYNKQLDCIIYTKISIQIPLYYAQACLKKRQFNQGSVKESPLNRDYI